MPDVDPTAAGNATLPASMTPSQGAVDAISDHHDDEAAMVVPVEVPEEALEAMRDILAAVDPRTWVESTPSGLAYHLAQVAAPLIAARVRATAGGLKLPDREER